MGLSEHTLSQQKLLHLDDEVADDEADEVELQHLHVLRHNLFVHDESIPSKHESPANEGMQTSHAT